MSLNSLWRVPNFNPPVDLSLCRKVSEVINSVGWRKWMRQPRIIYTLQFALALTVSLFDVPVLSAQEIKPIGYAETLVEECERLLKIERPLEAIRRCSAAETLLRAFEGTDAEVDKLRQRLSELSKEIRRRIKLSPVYAQFVPSVSGALAPPPYCTKPAGCIVTFDRRATQWEFADASPGAYLQPKGTLDVTVGASLTRSQSLPESGFIIPPDNAWFVPNVSLRYGVSDWLDAAFASSAGFRGKVTNGTADARIKLAEAGHRSPQVAFDVQLNIPLSDSGVSQWTPLFRISAEQEAAKRAAIKYSAGILLDGGVLQDPAIVSVPYNQQEFNPNPERTMRLIEYGFGAELPSRSPVRALIDVFGTNGLESPVRRTVAVSLGIAAASGPVIVRVSGGRGNEALRAQRSAYIAPEAWFMAMSVTMRTSLISNAERSR